LKIKRINLPVKLEGDAVARGGEDRARSVAQAPSALPRKVAKEDAGSVALKRGGVEGDVAPTAVEGAGVGGRARQPAAPAPARDELRVGSREDRERLAGRQGSNRD